MTVVRPYHRYRGEASFTLQKLVPILKEQLSLIAPEQSRYGVTTLPTERTIRFYTAQGLVDKPSGHDGQTARYGYRHLLQILVVKYLQSQYLPLRKIRSLVENAGNRDLEQLLPEIPPSVWTHRGLTRGDRRVTAVPSAYPFPPLTAAVSPAPTGPAPRIPDEPSAEAVPGAVTQEAGATPASNLDAWHRLEVGPGVELHVHAAALAAEDRERLRGVLLREMGVLRGWFGRGGKE